MARSCTNAVRKRAALTEPRAAAEPGTKRGRLGWWASWSRKDDDGLESRRMDATIMGQVTAKAAQLAPRRRGGRRSVVTTAAAISYDSGAAIWSGRLRLLPELYR